jgi:outer membrane protein assembly factor BamD (BamD/ComL family)
MFPSDTPGRAGAIMLVLLAIATPAFADTGETDLANAYSQAMAEFQAGNYAKAATDLEALVARVEVSPQVEPIFYTIGCAWFNAADYPKAIAAFRNYQGKYATGPHARAVAFAVARSTLLSGNYTDAAAQMAALENDPAMREQALLFEAQACKAAGKIDNAIHALERLVGKDIATRDAMEGATLLAQLYAQKDDGTRALQILELIHRQIGLADNILEVNALAVGLGDEFYKKQQYKEALGCYRFAWTREQVVRLQNERITAMQNRTEKNLAAARTNPTELARFALLNNQLKEEIATAQRRLADFEKLPPITPAIYLRLSRCFYELDRKWEAAVVSQEILDRFKQAPERESALFGLIVALADIHQSEQAKKSCEEYLRDFKDSPNAATVAYLLGTVTLQAGDPNAAETYFDRILQTEPKNRYREQIRYLIGNARFSAGSYDGAIAAYEKYLSEFPKGANAGDVSYRIILCSLFAGKYRVAMTQLQAYVHSHPGSSFVPDAKYRLAVCHYAASLYDEVINDCQAWEREFPGNTQLGEVLALRGDACAATDRKRDAIPIYIRSYQVAATDEVMNYSLFAASKLLQKEGEWDKVAALFAGFIERRPDHPAVVSAVYWIGKAKAHLGRIEEAKEFAVNTIKKHIADPDREAVEQLITQLAEFCARKGTAAAEDAELDRLLATRPEESSGPVNARILFAKAELARLHRHAVEEEKYMAAIAAGSKPDDLSPALLGKTGDYLLEKGRLDQAAVFYQRLLDSYPRSQWIDFAYNGLGEIAYRRKNFERALGFFTEGIEKIVAAQKLKDLTIGRGKTLLALGRLAPAQKTFEEIASLREWRGEATAFSVYSLGEIAAKRGQWAEANAYFQRVYVGYQKVLPWVAKAYLASGESFEKLHRKEEASNTYREMLRNEKLARFPESAEARKRLEALGEG